jgi:hypothetical protein
MRYRRVDGRPCCSVEGVAMVGMDGGQKRFIGELMTQKRAFDVFERQYDFVSSSNLIVVKFEADQHDVRDNGGRNHHCTDEGETGENAFRDRHRAVYLCHIVRPRLVRAPVARIIEPLV